MHDLIALQSVQDLVDAKVIRHATIVADEGVFKVNVKYKAVERTVSVRTAEGKIKERLFTSLDSVARFMQEKVHLAHYEIDAVNFDPAARAGKRPDTAERLRNAHAARSYNEWLQQKVDASVAGLSDGTNKSISADEWSALRAAKQARRDDA